MPLAVTHVLTTIILLDIYRDYFAGKKHSFTLHTVLIAGIGGLLPDIDIPINWILTFFNASSEMMQHGGITHTPFFAILFIVPGYMLWRMKRKKLAMYLFVLAYGILLHLSLDYVLGGGAYEGIMWLFPFSTASWRIHLIPLFNLHNIPAAIDAVILILWLWHEEAKHKISDFF